MVDEGHDESTVAVGSDLENAIWKEFGTGEYALHGDGRKGDWTYIDEKGQGHHTHGKTPNQPLTKAFQVMKPKILPQLKKYFKKFVIIKTELLSKIVQSYILRWVIMNKRQKNILQTQLDNEKSVIKALEDVFKKAKQECENKICELNSRTDMQNLQSIIYQKKYQEALAIQLDSMIKKLTG